MAMPFLPAVMKNSTKSSSVCERHVRLLLRDRRSGVGDRRLRLGGQLRRLVERRAADRVSSAAVPRPRFVARRLAVVFTTTGNLMSWISR